MAKMVVAFMVNVESDENVSKGLIVRRREKGETEKRLFEWADVNHIYSCVSISICHLVPEPVGFYRTREHRI